MQPAVQATTRTPGPSTVEPVVKEWRKPMSPVASAAPHVQLRNVRPRLTRSSNGLFARPAGVGFGHRRAYPWNVRLITSICCSRVRRTKFTA